MLQQKTIICFASGYDAPPTSKHHVMHLLAQNNQVLWINYHASRAPQATVSDMKYIFEKLRQCWRGLQKRRPNLDVLTPLVIPLPSSAWARQLNRKLLLWQIKRALQKRPAHSCQIWSFTPDIGYALGHFGEEKVVYYCVDDHAAFSGYNKAQVLEDEKALCRQADLVITTSVTLQQDKSPWNPHTVLIPHGVDFDHFHQAVTQTLPEPADIAAIPRPRLGFFGLLRDWVDLDLLAHIAGSKPQWHFVLIGDADSNVNLSQYQNITNMHFLGRRPYADLPSYCQYFDAGLIPFKINDLTRAVNPIKLREYLAAGLPVISTPMPDVDLYKEQVEIGSGPEAFSQAIERSLKKPQQQRAEAVQAMSGETWDAKVAQIVSRLQAL